LKAGRVLAVIDQVFDSRGAVRIAQIRVSYIDAGIDDPDDRPLTAQAGVVPESGSFGPDGGLVEERAQGRRPRQVPRGMRRRDGVELRERRACYTEVGPRAMNTEELRILAGG
jgi:hypothetical protein